jgi:hypothetical protein
VLVAPGLPAAPALVPAEPALELVAPLPACVPDVPALGVMGDEAAPPLEAARGGGLALPPALALEVPAPPEPSVVVDLPPGAAVPPLLMPVCAAAGPSVPAMAMVTGAPVVGELVQAADANDPMPGSSSKTPRWL